MALMIVFALVVSTGCGDMLNRLTQAKLPMIDDVPASSQVEPADSATTHSLDKW